MPLKQQDEKGRDFLQIKEKKETEADRLQVMPESMNPRLSASPKVPVPHDLEKQPVKSLPSDSILDNLHRSEVRGPHLTNQVKLLCDTKIKAVHQNIVAFTTSFFIQITSLIFSTHMHFSTRYLSVCIPVSDSSFPIFYTCVPVGQTGTIIQ